MSPKPAKGPHLTYRPGLDGLRALAVAGVFLYHAKRSWLPGGFLGVDLFFVLSGYLITSILLLEWEHHGRIVLLRFWGRRARRLFPAVVVVILAALALSSIFARTDLARTRSDAISSLFYYTNWHLIVANHSYFTLMGQPSLLQHFWSLAVEEQFYVVWPLLLVPGLVFLGRRYLPIAVAAGIAGSATEMWLLYKGPDSDPSRVYYGTDTRAFLLLMGIELALLWPYVERIKRSLPVLELLGVAALGLTIWLFWALHDFDPTVYRGGDLAASFCFAVLIGAVAHQATRLGKALGAAPLRWVGERSYGMYLWHWPIIAITRPGVDVSWAGNGGLGGYGGVLLVLIQAALTVTAAALSFRFVEQPIRTGRLQRRLAEIGAERRLQLVGAGTVALVAAFAVLFVVPSPLNATAAPTQHHHTKKPKNSHHTKKPRHHHKKKPKNGGPPSGHILALGDSVMLGCSSELREALHHRVRVDAVVARQIDDTITELDRLRHKWGLPKTVILQVGNNGPLYYRDLVRLRTALRGVPDVIVVNVRNSTSWQDESNHAIDTWLDGWRQAHLADWYGHSKASMLSDGTHPFPQACWTYASVIATTFRTS